MILPVSGSKMALEGQKTPGNTRPTPKMAWDSPKHVQNDLFGLKKHPKNTPVLKGTFFDFLTVSAYQRRKTLDFPYLFMKSLDQR